MNKKYTSLVLAGLMCFSSVTPAFAYDLDENNNSIESIEYQNTEDEDYTNKTSVFAELGSEYKVTIPKTIVLSGTTKSANYYVKVEGDIAGYEIVNVVPDNIVNLYTKNKDSQTGIITQDKTTWKVSDFDVDANGQVTANGLTAGKWSGTFNFNINLDSHEEFVLGDLVLPPIGFDATSPAQTSANQVVNAKVGDSGSIDITYNNEDVAKDVAITSSNEDVVKVDKNRLTAVNVGTSTITVDYDTAKSGNDEGIKSYSFDVKVSKDEKSITLAAGLYDENNNLIKSWDELVELGLDVEKGYSYDPSFLSYYKNSSSSGYSIFTNNNLSGKLVIPNSVTSIGARAFAGCTSLTSVIIPDSVTNIGIHAFLNCTSLTSITIPNSVTTFEQGTFSGCAFTSIEIPDSVTTIGVSAFHGCTSLTSITIPDSVATIGQSAFQNCYSLKSIEIPDSVTTIGNGVFINCSSLKSIIIPDSVTTIESTTFSGCTSLISITIPNSVTSIGNNAFSTCTSLTSITIPNSVTSIGKEAFYNCKSLTSITIPNSITTIEDSVFCKCKLLTSVTVPDSVTSIGSSAFNKCTSLTSITYNGTTVQWTAIQKGSNWNYNMPNCVVHCTDGDITL